MPRLIFKRTTYGKMLSKKMLVSSFMFVFFISFVTCGHNEEITDEKPPRMVRLFNLDDLDINDIDQFANFETIAIMGRTTSTGDAKLNPAVNHEDYVMEKFIIPKIVVTSPTEESNSNEGMYLNEETYSRNEETYSLKEETNNSSDEKYSDEDISVSGTASRLFTTMFRPIKFIFSAFMQLLGIPNY